MNFLSAVSLRSIPKLLTISSIIWGSSIGSNVVNQQRTISQSKMLSGSQLSDVIEKLSLFAPEKYAESWDNVGLLIQPTAPKEVKKILLTNDLTERVLQEAVDAHTDLIISYHPPIFSGLKRITQSSWKERIVAVCLENRIALYSPHTSWDAVRGGVNDWLAKSIPHSNSAIILPNGSNPDFGAGRLFTADTQVTLKEAIQWVKQHTGVQAVHVAVGASQSLESLVKTVAVCAGSGSSVLKGVAADLYITGEMSHHEVLDAVHNNVSVFLVNHSNSERGFLLVFQEALKQLLKNDNVEISVSKQDVDPLVTY